MATAAPVDGSPSPLRVVVVDDDPLVRRVVRETLQRAGIMVVAEGASAADAVRLALRFRPHVLLMDVVMPDGDGIAATREIAGQLPDLPIVLLTNADDEDLAVPALRAGAIGILRKDAGLDALPQALRGASAGEAVLSRRLGRRLISRLREEPEVPPDLRPVRSPLTTREWEVVGLLEQGCSTDEIADKLVLARETVRTHVKNVLRKLDARSRAEAVARARELRRGP
jgi:DNA-binding NarL/FixJ family response regulator